MHEIKAGQKGQCMTLITALKSKNKIQGEHTGYIQVIHQN